MGLVMYLEGNLVIDKNFLGGVTLGIPTGKGVYPLVIFTSMESFIRFISQLQTFCGIKKDIVPEAFLEAFKEEDDGHNGLSPA
jgi:hypothetical protein